MKIVSIEELPEEILMCDIQVTGNNLFYANGILTHNSAIEATREQKSIGQDHIQGGISKINTSDLVIALVKDEAMEAAGEYRFEFLKARNSNAVNKKLTMAWDAESLQISDVGLNFISRVDRPLVPNGKTKGPRTVLTMGETIPGQQPMGLSDLLGRKS